MAADANGILYYKPAHHVALQSGRSGLVKKATTEVLRSAEPGDKITFRQRNGSYSVKAVEEYRGGVRVYLANGGLIEPSSSIYQYLTEKEATDHLHQHYRDGILITGVEVNGEGPDVKTGERHEE